MADPFFQSVTWRPVAVIDNAKRDSKDKVSVSR